MTIIKWISVKDELPKLETYYDEDCKSFVQEVTKEVIVSDGESSWGDYYSEEDGFHESIIEWMYLPLPSKKK